MGGGGGGSTRPCISWAATVKFGVRTAHSGIKGYLPTAISSLNKYLAEVGMTPYTKTKASQPYYPDKKMKEITESMKQLILSEPGEDDSEMIRQLKDKFSKTGKRGEQMQILTVLPQSNNGLSKR